MKNIAPAILWLTLLSITLNSCKDDSPVSSDTSSLSEELVGYFEGRDLTGTGKERGINRYSQEWVFRGYQEAFLDVEKSGQGILITKSYRGKTEKFEGIDLVEVDGGIAFNIKEVKDNNGTLLYTGHDGKMTKGGKKVDGFFNRDDEYFHFYLESYYEGDLNEYIHIGAFKKDK